MNNVFRLVNPVYQELVLILAFTRYCHYQYCIACIAIQDGRGETPYCAMVWAMKRGGGAPKQGGCLRIIVLILVQWPRTKRISCKGQYLFKGNVFIKQAKYGLRVNGGWG